MEKDKKEFTRTISCPNCPINCYTINGALRHKDICDKRRREGYCCLCKDDKENKDPDYYNPEENRFWYLCWRCYNWAKSKSICL